jgi:tetratricopeptide (TPR) repeat protein
MGVVFQGFDHLDGRPVAVKLLRSKDPTEVARFEREAAVLAELCHPGIVRYIAHGTTPAGEHYLVMEWLEGEDLRQRFQKQPLTPAEALALVHQLALALAYAHARGILHRDLKPSNIFLVNRQIERAKLLDFGIARLTWEAERLTNTGLVIGTPGYMAPEQVQTLANLDPRADVFSLGCILFECMTGRRAFSGADVMAVLAKILLEEIPLLRKLRPDVPEPLERLVARMLARDPAARPRDAAEVAAEVEQLSTLVDTWSAHASPIEVTPADSLPSQQPTVQDAARLPSSLTMIEQRLVSVVLAGAPGTEEMSTTQDLVAPEISRCGGQLNVLPDGSMLVTLWGAGSAVDRAVRAAHCALALQERFAFVPICVVTGRGVVSARVVEGEVIDRGVRALRAARPGAIALDGATVVMLGGGFIIEADEDEVVLRGERNAPDAAPLLLGRQTACVGRNRELTLLETIFAGCVSESQADAVLVTGTAGAGKSRLRREFIARLRRRGETVEVLSGRADSLGESAPFGAMADAIRNAAGIQGGEPLEVRREKLTRRLSRCLEGEKLVKVSGFLGEMIRSPFDDDGNPALRAARDNAQIMGDATRAAWEDWLTAECAAQPVLLALDDLHWGDLATVRLVDATLRNLRELPLMVLVLARPEIHTRFPELWVERDVQIVRLGPLSRKASEQLVRDALGREARLDVIRRIVERADGNAFYLEELIRAVAAGRGDTFPDSVLGTVEARLDAEGSEAKRVLRAASVFGERFSTHGVAALLGGDEHLSEVGGRLSALAARELITRASASDGVDDDGYVFRHALIREAAYATLTEADRALGHRLAGEWLEQRGSSEALMMAEHFRRGGELLRAVPWYRRAAEQALAADDLAAVLERVARGVACGAAGEALGAMRLAEAEAHAWRGELALAEQRGIEATERLAPGTVAWFRAVTEVINAAGKAGNVDHIEPWIDKICTTVPVAGARTAQIICQCICARMLSLACRYGAAEALSEMIDRELCERPTDDAAAIAALEEMRGFRASTAGDSGACLEHLRGALVAFEQAGDRRNACNSRANLGYILAELGDFAAAEEALRAALATAERMEIQFQVAIVLHNLGHVLSYRGQLEEARLLEQRAVDVLQRQGDLRMKGCARTYLAKIELLSLDPGAAEREARAAAEALVAAAPLRAGALAVLARALLAQGRAAEALEAAHEAFSLLETLGTIEEGEALVRLVYAEALAANGKQPEFIAAVSAARDRLLTRAAKISDPVWRERFLTSVPDNAQTLSLALRADSSPSMQTVSS